MNKLYLLIIILLVSYSCEHKATVTSIEIPALSTPIDNLIAQKISQLDLENLQQGFDSIQIRIWYDYSLIDRRDLIVLKNTNKTWSGAHYTLRIKWDPNNDKETVLDKKIESVTPVSGWDTFIPELLELRLASLPNMNDIPGLVDTWSDGTSYGVELAKGSQYRFYSYHVPNEFAKKYWQAAKMTSIIDLLQKEFKIWK